MRSCVHFIVLEALRQERSQLNERLSSTPEGAGGTTDSPTDNPTGAEPQAPNVKSIGPG